MKRTMRAPKTKPAKKVTDDSDYMYHIELHSESNMINEGDVIRVPGGWIYKFYDIGQAVFVPFSDEFM